MTDTFEITTDHITLLRAADWDNNEGAPGIDWKRPYLGTSSVREALAEILIPGYREMTAEQTEAIHEEHDDRLWDLHTDLGKVIAIGIDTLTFAPGIYRRGDAGWKLVTAAMPSYEALVREAIAKEIESVFILARRDMTPAEAMDEAYTTSAKIARGEA